MEQHWNRLVGDIGNICDIGNIGDIGNICNRLFYFASLFQTCSNLFLWVWNKLAIVALRLN